MSEPLLTEETPEVRDDVRILFLGVGHAGGVLISHLPKRVPEFSYAAIDTDKQSLGKLPLERKILLGESLTNGLGTGGNPELAESCLEEGHEDLYGLFQDVDVLILVAGLGGGTGSVVGAAMAESARESGALVLSALVKPLEAEGGSRLARAEAAIVEYREQSDGVFLFPLEQLKVSEDPSMLLPRLLKRCGMEIGRSLGGLAVLLRTGWILPMSVQDLVQTLQRADGYCRLVATSAEGQNRVSESLDKLFTHPLIDKGSLLAHSGGVLMGVLCGPQTPLAELETLSVEIRRVLRSDAEWKLGIGQDDRFGRHIALVVMVTEKWSATTVPLEVVTQEEPEETPEGTTVDKALIQSEIDLASPNKGRFKDSAPTIVAGTDLDTPTFIRKGIKLSFQRSKET
jgi:cell division protein FtsZ